MVVIDRIKNKFLRFGSGPQYADTLRQMHGVAQGKHGFTDEALRDDATARVAATLKKPGKRYAKVKGKALAEGQEYEGRYRAGHVPHDWAPPLDWTLICFAVMFLTWLVPSQVLEFGTTRPALDVFETTLGGPLMTTFIAYSLGAIFTLAGHAIGHIGEWATHARGKARVGLATFAVVFAAAMLFAIHEIGVDRSGNLNSSAKTTEASILRAGAGKLNKDAREADRRAVVAALGQDSEEDKLSAAMAVPPPSPDGDALRADAKVKNDRADDLEKEAADSKGLKAFSAVQSGALLLSIAAGFMFSTGAMQRTRRSYVRGRAKADDIRFAAKRDLLAVVSIDFRAGNLAGIESLTDARTWAAEVFEEMFPPEPKWPDLEELEGPQNNVQALRKAS